MRTLRPYKHGLEYVIIATKASVHVRKSQVLRRKAANAQSANVKLSILTHLYV